MPGAMHRMGVYLGLVEDDEYAEGSEGWDGGRDSAERAPARRESYADSRYSRETRHDGRPEAGARDTRPDTRHENRGAVSTLPRQYREPSEDYTDASYANGSGGSMDPVGGGGYDYQPTGYQITALHPRTYNEARTIGEAFRQSTPVIMNLSEMDDADAKRLVDFAAGLTFGLHGRIERVTAKVFLLSPHNVTVTAQDKARIENGFFNQS